MRVNKRNNESDKLLDAIKKETVAKLREKLGQYIHQLKNGTHIHYQTACIYICMYVTYKHTYTCMYACCLIFIFMLYLVLKDMYSCNKGTELV